MDRLAALLFGFLIILVSAQAEAHSPYLIEKAKIDHGGLPLTLYEWYGDGIFFTDPVAVVVLNDKNDLYAQTEVAAGATTICINADNCWVFLQNGVLPISDIYRLSLLENYIKPTHHFSKEYPEQVDPKRISFGSEITPIPFIEFFIYPISNLYWFLPSLLVPLGCFVAIKALAFFSWPKPITILLSALLYLVIAASHIMAFFICLAHVVGLLPYLVVSWILLYKIAAWKMNRVFKKRQMA